MAAVSFLDRFLKCNCQFMHAARRGALVRVVESLVGGARLNLSALGRNLAGDGKTKHKIKLVDRLLGNRHVDAERERVFAAITQWALAHQRRPVIAVDWSDLETGNHTQLLKAAVCIRGRALTLYEQVHPVKGLRRGQAERRFLDDLAAMMAPGCCPIIVTDAGFHGPWLRKVHSLGWDYVGRMRGQLRVQRGGEDRWFPIKELHALASSAAACLGVARLSHRTPYVTRLCVYRGFVARPGRRPGDRPKNPKWREPWVLATSLSSHTTRAAQVVSLYRKRMQIEETFRDMKAPRWGFAIGYARSRSLARRANLALIAALALFALWLTGLAARTLGWHRDFQANTERERPVLSDVFLGREVYRFRERYALTEDIIAATADLLRLDLRGLEHC